jgi:hypothetical protein
LRSTLAVEQPRRPRDERARTHRQDRRAGVRSGAYRVYRLGRIAADRPRGYRDEVHADQPVEAVLWNQLCADRRSQRFTGDRTANAEVEVRHAIGLPIDPEHLADDAELEDRDAIHHQC